jgi:hypothetical protein
MRGFSVLFFLVACAFLPSFSIVIAQDFDIEVSTLSFESVSDPLILSRNGNSIVGRSNSGALTLMRNSFQFDQTSVALPESIASGRVMAVSYYGAVYSVTKSELGCFLTVYTQFDTIIGPVLISSNPSCEVVSGSANVTDRFVFSVVEGERTQLFLYFDGKLEVVWDSSLYLGTNVNFEGVTLEGFAMNDLNTVVFTVSGVVKGKRTFESFFWVPARGVSVLKFPRAAGTRPVIRDVNNKNKYLVSAPGGTAVFDSSKKRITLHKTKATRLTYNSSPFSATTLYSIDGNKVLASCFATGALANTKVQFGAINDEREILLISSTPVSVKVAKIIPFALNGYPKCSVARRTKRTSVAMVAATLPDLSAHLHT